MGLIKAGLQAAKSVAADQWKDYFSCDAIPVDTLVVKGQRKNATKGADNIISNGSVISIANGQCMMIVEQGKVVEVSAEPGEFVFDTSSEPSIFAGELGDVFANVAKRFTFGGATGNDQRIYYFNTRELTGNKYGTANPVPFRVVDPRAGIDIDISLRCFGEYSFRMINPLAFYANVCGNVKDRFMRSEIEEQLKTELLTALQPALAKISSMGIRYSEIPAHTLELTDALNEVLTEKWKELRGIEIVSIGVSSVKASEEDEAMLKELQKTAAFKDPNMAAAQLVSAQSSAMKEAAKNPNGAMMGFMGLNAASQNGGMNAQALYEMGATSTPQTSDGWTCSCGATNTGKFCSECGQPKPEVNTWTCSCGANNTGKFCSECGQPKPSQAACPSCGWKPEEGQATPKFCPECGKPFESK